MRSLIGILGLLAVVNAHTVYMCINPGVNQITVYAATYHTNSRRGGIIIAGGELGNEQYDPICPKPYGAYTSGSRSGEVPCSVTNGKDNTSPSKPWSCGDRFDWDNSAVMTYAQVAAEAPHGNCDEVGDSSNSFSQINSPRLTWNKVTIPVDKCGENINYALVSTSDSCDDSPWMNVWANVECVPGNLNVNRCNPSLSCPPDQTLSAGLFCDASRDYRSLATVRASHCSGVSLMQSTSSYSLGSNTVTMSLATHEASTKRCSFNVEVVDVDPPHVTAPPNKVIECGDDETPTNTGNAHVHENCDYDLTYEDAVTEGDCEGEKTIVRTFTAIDSSGNTDSSVQVISVEDNTPPVQNEQDQLCLWPPNNKFRCFENILSSSFVSGDDTCGDVNLSFAGCTSNQESENANNPYYESDCHYSACTDTLCVRSYRTEGVCPGREYNVLFNATDSCGNVAVFNQTILVPNGEDDCDLNHCLVPNVHLDHTRDPGNWYRGLRGA